LLFHGDFLCNPFVFIVNDLADVQNFVMDDFFETSEFGAYFFLVEDIGSVLVTGHN
jgi:hypothetical protein